MTWYSRYRSLLNKNIFFLSAALSGTTAVSILSASHLYQLQSNLVYTDGRVNDDQSGRSKFLKSHNSENVSYIDRWKQTLNKTCPSIVSLHMMFPRSFEDRTEACSQATGFVIHCDKEAGVGYILTNRHVVSTGPVIMEALFLNGEKVDVQPIYRDPVHDFAFLRFNPRELKYIHPLPIKLAPEKAHVGLDVRVIGNNAGERLTISSGTLARMDRSAPNYGRNKYNDFNTFYYQCASSTTGGSSGSPVLDIEGNCIALNAGGITGASNAFYLPLDRVRRAFELIKDDMPVCRGTLEATFEFKSFFQLAQLGLPQAIEDEIRMLKFATGDLIESPEVNTNSEYVLDTHETSLGLLVCESSVPGGPAARGGMQSGDILYKVNGKHVVDFITLESALDSSIESYILETRVKSKFDDPIVEDIVPKTPEQPPLISVELFRKGKLKKFTTCVSDLHDISPHFYYEVGGSVFHEIGYQMARQKNIPCLDSGVVIARPGVLLSTTGLPARMMITEVNDVKTPDLLTLVAILHHLKPNEKAKFKVFRPGDIKTESIIYVDWTKAGHDEVFSLRDDHEGTWKHFRREALDQLLAKCVPSISGLTSRQTPDLSRHAPVLANGCIFPLNNIQDDLIPDEVTKKILNSFVEVKFTASHKIDGHSEQSFLGAGLIVDIEKGLVIADRDTVTCAFGTPKLYFGNCMEVPATIEYFHPLFNLVLLKYDPSSVAHLPLSQAEFTTLINRTKEDIAAIKTSKKEAQSKRDRFFGMNLMSEGGLGSSIETTSGKIKLIRTEQPPPPVPPKFTGTQFDRIQMGSGSSTLTDTNGVYCTYDGKILGFQACFPVHPDKKVRDYWYGIPSDIIVDLLDSYKKSGKNIAMKGIGANFKYIGLRRAKELGCPEDVLINATEFESQRAEPGSTVMLVVDRTWGGVDAEKLLHNDDVLYKLDGSPVFSFYDLFKLIQGKQKVMMTIIREGKALEFQIATVDLSHEVTERMLLWQGCTLQDIHTAAVEQGVDKNKGGAYISSRKYGSPAEKAGLFPTMRITEADKSTITCLDDFLEVVKDKKSGDVIWLKTEDLYGIVKVVGMRIHTLFFPTALVDCNQEDIKLIVAE